MCRYRITSGNEAPTIRTVREIEILFSPLLEARQVAFPQTYSSAQHKASCQSVDRSTTLSVFSTNSTAYLRDFWCWGMTGSVAGNSESAPLTSTTITTITTIRNNHQIVRPYILHLQSLLYRLPNRRSCRTLPPSTPVECSPSSNNMAPTTAPPPPSPSPAPPLTPRRLHQHRAHSPRLPWGI